MFGFFATLFGGAYIAGKIAKENSESKIINNYRSHWDSIYKRMRNMSGDAGELILEIKKAWETEDPNRIWHIISKIPDYDLAYIFGEHWKETLSYFINNIDDYTYDLAFCNLSSIPDIISTLVMSVYGLERILQKYTLIGSVVGIPAEYTSLSKSAPSYKYQTEIYPDFRKRVCKVVEKNMRKYYPDIELVTTPYEKFWGPQAVWNLSLAPGLEYTKLFDDKA